MIKLEVKFSKTHLKHSVQRNYMGQSICKCKKVQIYR